MKCRVSMSGFRLAQGKPDIKLPNELNELSPICRVCRVLFRRRDLLRISGRRISGLYIAYFVELIGLE
jgi:hypothetical protein